MFPYTERFCYDALDRLTKSGEYGSEDHFAYAQNGNIVFKTGIGHYLYESEKPHAVTLVENTENRISYLPLLTPFNAFGKITSLQNVGGCYNNMEFTYGPDNERWSTRLTGTGTYPRMTYYMGDCEKTVHNGHTRKLFYLNDGAIFVRQDNAPDSVYYMFTDHLGSIVSIVDYEGNNLFHASYDAWGNQTVYHDDIGFRRGYTGHEMLPEFGLINMNGRLYDPLVGRFLSPDNYVQMPFNAQNFNRYSYCLNNPMKYIDPDGEVFWFIAGAAVLGGAINLGIKAYQGQISSFSDGLAAFGIGAAAGALGAISGGITFAAAGGAAGGVGGFYAGLISGVTSSAIAMPINNLANHVYFGDCLMSTNEYFLGIAISGIIGGSFNGFSALNNGRTFFHGKPNIQMPLQSIEPVSISNSVGHYYKDSATNPIIGKEETIFEVTTSSPLNSVTKITERNAIVTSRPKIAGYNLSNSVTNDLYHRFPIMFDEQIINEGSLYGTYGNSSMYYASGHINGKMGIYTIGINNQTGVVYHRCFYSFEKFLHDFKFP